ncbi:MAG: DUF4407 domain-containing protein [Bacteroidota bacterium]
MKTNFLTTLAEWVTLTDNSLMAQATPLARIKQRRVGYALLAVICISCVSFGNLIWSCTDLIVITIFMTVVYGVTLFQLESITFGSFGSGGALFRVIVLVGATYLFHRSNEHVVFSKEIHAQIGKTYESKKLAALQPIKDAQGDFSARKGGLDQRKQQLQQKRDALMSKLNQEVSGQVLDQSSVSGVSGNGPRARAIRAELAIADGQLNALNQEYVAAASDHMRDSATAELTYSVTKDGANPHYSTVERDAALLEAQESPETDDFHKRAFAIWSRVVLVFSAFFESMVLILKKIAKSDYTLLAEGNQKLAEQVVQRRTDLMMAELKEHTTPSDNSQAIRADLKLRIKEANSTYRHIITNYQDV